jgi:serine/threonine-protein kinase RsbW
MAADGRASVALDGAAGPDLLDRVLDAVAELWAAVPGVPQDDRLLFSLAVSEILTNIAQHGTPGGRASVRLEVSADALRAEIRDGSPPISIDWTAISMPDADAESGRGLALAVAALDELQVQAETSGNLWVLVRRVTEDAGEDHAS